MAVRTAFAGTIIAGDSISAVNNNKLPGGWLGYAEVTANQTGITTEVDLTSLTVTVTVGPARRIMVTGSTYLLSTVLSDRMAMAIYEGAGQLQIANVYASTSTDGYIAERSVILTPSSGAHTYKLTARRVTGTGSVTSQAAATFPAWILVQDIGPAA
jgi:hypothetical protein